MSYLTLSTYQVTLAAMLPKRGPGATAEALAASTGFPLDLVERELQQMVVAGLMKFEPDTGKYSNKGDRDE